MNLLKENITTLESINKEHKRALIVKKSLLATLFIDLSIATTIIPLVFIAFLPYGNIGWLMALVILSLPNIAYFHFYCKIKKSMIRKYTIKNKEKIYKQLESLNETTYNTYYYFKETETIDMDVMNPIVIERYGYSIKLNESIKEKLKEEEEKINEEITQKASRYKTLIKFINPILTTSLILILMGVYFSIAYSITGVLDIMQAKSEDINTDFTYWKIAFCIYLATPVIAYLIHTIINKRYSFLMDELYQIAKISVTEDKALKTLILLRAIPMNIQQYAEIFNYKPALSIEELNNYEYINQNEIRETEEEIINNK